MRMSGPSARIGGCTVVGGAAQSRVRAGCDCGEVTSVSGGNNNRFTKNTIPPVSLSLNAFVMGVQRSQA